MIKLKALCDQEWREYRSDTVAGIREAWAGIRGSFGIISVDGERDPVPRGWQSKPGFLLVTPAFLRRHAPALRVEIGTDGSLPVVTDPSFRKAEFHDLSASPAPRAVPTFPRAPGPDPEPRPGPAPLILADYPEWFLSVPLSELHLPRRLGEAFPDNWAVGDLLCLDRSFVTDAPNLGYGAVERLRNRAQEAYVRLLAKRMPVAARPAVGGPVSADGQPATAEAGPPAAAVNDGYTLGEPLAEHLLGQLVDLPGDDAAILSARLGLAGPPLRFEDIARTRGGSREQARARYLGAARAVDGRTGCFSVLKGWLSASGRPRAVDAPALLSEPWTAGMPLAAVEFLIWELAGLKFARTTSRKGGGAFEPILVEILRQAPGGISRRDAAAAAVAELGRSPSEATMDAVLARRGREVVPGLWTLGPLGGGPTDRPSTGA